MSACRALLVALVVLAKLVSAVDESLIDAANERVAELRGQIKQGTADFLTYLDLAALLHQLDYHKPDGGSRVVEAEEAYKTALLTAPAVETKAAILQSLSALQLSAGRAEEALETAEQGIKLASSNTDLKKDKIYAGLLFNRCKVLGQLGRLQEEQDCYRESLAGALGVSPSVWTKSMAALLKHSEQDIEDMQAAATYLHKAATSSRTKQKKISQKLKKWKWLDGISPTDRSWLHFALFRVLDKGGHYKKAWSHLQLANELQFEEGNLADVQKEKLALDALRSFFGEQHDPHSRDGYHMLLSGALGYHDNTPIFVVGVPRSGSTLVEQMLATHSTVAGAGEDTPLPRFIGQYLRIVETASTPEQYQAAAEIGAQYIDELRSKVGAVDGRVGHVVDKMLNNVWHVGHIAMMLPAGCIIRVVRHPLDVALSCFAQPFEGRGLSWAGDLEAIADMIQHEHDIAQHWKRVLPGKMMEVNYEHLVNNFEEVSREVLSHCNLPWEPNVAQFHDTDRVVQTASLAQVRQPLYKSAIGKWKRYDKQLKVVKQKLEGLIEEYEQSVGMQEVQQEASGNEWDEL